ncbi:DUF2190 family protein [bacterium]|nr:DUF2190 family protein [bacterium]
MAVGTIDPITYDFQDPRNIHQFRRFLEELRQKINTIIGASGSGSIAAGGSDTHVQFNDSTLLSGDANFTWTKGSATLLVTGTLNVAGNIGVTGTVDGRDVALDGTNQDTHIADTSIHFSGIDGLSDVTITAVADNDFLQYDTASGQWQNRAEGLTGNMPDSLGEEIITVDSGLVTVDLGYYLRAEDGTIITTEAGDPIWLDRYALEWAEVDKTVSDIADITTRSHTSLTNIGTNTHPQIDTHIVSDGSDHGFIDQDVTTTSSPTFNAIQFDLTPVHVHSEGAIHWDDDDKTLNIDTEVSGTAIQVGQEIVLRATNKTGVAITNGSVVYVNGAQGNRPTIALADADAAATADSTIGVVTADIANNGTGYVTTFGLVRGLNTNAFTEGDVLWLSQTAGEFTATEPVSPAHSIRIGYVITKNVTEGVIFVEIDTGSDLADIHDVLLSGIADDDLLQYDSATGLWKNVAKDGVITMWTRTGTTISPTNAGDFLDVTGPFRSYGTLVTKYDSSATESVSVNSYNDITITASGETLSLTDMVDGSNVQLRNNSGGDATLNFDVKVGTNIYSAPVTMPDGDSYLLTYDIGNAQWEL